MLTILKPKTVVRALTITMLLFVVMFLSQPLTYAQKPSAEPDVYGWDHGRYGYWYGWEIGCYNGTCYEEFKPNRVGTHAVEVRGTNGNWGRVKISWRDGSGPWHYFHTMQVGSGTAHAHLYSGSSSINYQFEFIQEAGAGDAQFRKFKD